MLMQERAVAEAEAAASTSQLRMYVYRLNNTGCHQSVAPFTSASNFLFESHIEEELRAITNVTSDPEEADIFFVPACLTQAWEAQWQWSPSGNLTSKCVQCLNTHERQVLADMRAVGPYYKKWPERHLLNRHACPHTNQPSSVAIGAGQPVYLDLWHRKGLRYVCVETSVPDQMARYNMSFDASRAVHVPYWTNATLLAAPLPYANRTRNIGFAGSFCCGRQHLKQVVGAKNVFQIPDIRTMGNAEANDDALIVASAMRNITDYIRTSRFIIEPHGDTPERMQIYTALLEGTPVIFPNYVAPPLGLANWNGAAITSSVPLESPAFKVAMTAYQDSMMMRFGTARLPFLWGTHAFRSHLQGVLHQTFESHAPIAPNRSSMSAPLPLAAPLWASPVVVRWFVIGGIACCIGLVILFVWLLRTDNKKVKGTSENSTLLPSAK